MKIIDISLSIYEGMPVYPGTSATKIRTVRSASGQSTLSEIRLTSHTGTHVDAPAHSVEGGETLDKLDLNSFYGPARVLDLTAVAAAIQPADLEAKGIMNGERILLKTANSKVDYSKFNDNYVHLSGDAAEYLAQLGVKLVGIDAFSVKKRGDKDNTSHTSLLNRGIPILEGLNLDGVNEGNYILSALPLALKGDGAPARAVLIK